MLFGIIPFDVRPPIKVDSHPQTDPHPPRLFPIPPDCSPTPPDSSPTTQACINVFFVNRVTSFQRGGGGKVLVEYAIDWFGRWGLNKPKTPPKTPHLPDCSPTSQTVPPPPRLFPHGPKQSQTVPNGPKTVPKQSQTVPKPINKTKTSFQ